MQSNGLIRIAPQYLLVDDFRLRQATLVVVLYGEVQGLLDKLVSVAVQTLFCLNGPQGDAVMLEFSVVGIGFCDAVPSN